MIGDLLAGQRVMTQRVFERVRRVELALGVEPSHYERGRRSADAGASARRWAPGAAPAAARLGRPPTTARPPSFLAIGVGLTGVITYVYFFIASHVLSKPDYGEITVLWSAVFITISTLYRPVEQLLSRHISEHLVKGEPIGEPMRVAATIQLGLALLLRGPRAGLPRAAPGRPARGQRNPLLGLLRRRPLLRRQLLRPRLPRRRRSASASSPR